MVPEGLLGALKGERSGSCLEGAGDLGLPSPKLSMLGPALQCPHSSWWLTARVR